MMTFDQIIPTIASILHKHKEDLSLIGPFIINRDLNGRVRLVLEEKKMEQTNHKRIINSLAQAMSVCLGLHGFPPDQMILYVTCLETVKKGAPHFCMEGFQDVIIVDRLANETDWAKIEPVDSGAPRIVFFSIKGGVGRSTASAVTAWSLAQLGKRVMVLDLDLESPGISSILLPFERRPDYGITDWLVEDLVNNGPAVFPHMVAKSDLSHDGEVFVVPAHGKEPGEYIEKLGRVWMPKTNGKGIRETWSKRLHRLLLELEKEWQPDALLIDSRAGIDEVASACVTDLGAKTVLLFTIDGDQAWSGYQMLFRHWRRTGAAQEIRDRLRLVGAMIPEVNRPEYFDSLCERSWTTFSEELYDEVPAGESADAFFSFDRADESAPHYPWGVKWHRGFSALQSIHSLFPRIDKEELMAVFGPLIDGIRAIIEDKGDPHE